MHFGAPKSGCLLTWGELRWSPSPLQRTRTGHHCCQFLWHITCADTENARSRLLHF